MTNSQPPEPGSSRRNPLGFDDFIGIFVAFSTIGAILFWSFLQRSPDGNIASWFSPAPTSTAPPNPVPQPGGTVNNVPLAPLFPSTQTAPADPNAGVIQPQGGQVPILGNQPATPGTVAVAPNIQRSPQVGVVPVPVIPITPAPPAPVQPQTQAPVIPVPPPPAKPAPVAKQPPAPPQKLATQRPALAFVDVKNDFWAKPFIDGLSSRGLIDGFTTKNGKAFQPNTPITRAEFAALINKAFTNQPGGQKTVFKDIPAKFWATSAISGVTKTQFMRGYPGNVFRPQQKIPREQVVVALASGLNLRPKSPPAQVVGMFDDALQISSYAVDRVAAATEAGIVVNYPKANEFKPKLTATRAEVAAMVYQALEQAGKVQPISSKYIVKPQ